MTTGSGSAAPASGEPARPGPGQETVVEMTGLEPPRSGVVPRGLVPVAALSPLLAAGAARVYWGDALAGSGSLVWLAGLASFGVLAYFRGWKGSVIAGLLVVAAFIGAEAAASAWRGVMIQWHAFEVVTAVSGGLTLCVGTLAEQLHRRRREAFRLAFTDPASGLLQRRLLTLFLRQQVAAARRGEPLAVALIGLDGLEAFRERHGEEAASVLLGRVGDVVLNDTRGSDVAGRWSGDRFLAVLPGSERDGARVFAGRVLERLDGLSAPLSDGSLVRPDLEVRVGVATFDASVRDEGDLVHRAERALGAAEAPGGPAVTVFQSPERVAV